jgi:hypothetical protein
MLCRGVDELLAGEWMRSVRRNDCRGSYTTMGKVAELCDGRLREPLEEIRLRAGRSAFDETIGDDNLSRGMSKQKMLDDLLDAPGVRRRYGAQLGLG